MVRDAGSFVRTGDLGEVKLFCHHHVLVWYGLRKGNLLQNEPLPIPLAQSRRNAKRPRYRTPVPSVPYRYRPRTRRNRGFVCSWLQHQEILRQHLASGSPSSNRCTVLAPCSDPAGQGGYYPSPPVNHGANNLAKAACRCQGGGRSPQLFKAASMCARRPRYTTPARFASHARSTV